MLDVCLALLNADWVAKDLGVDGFVYHFDLWCFLHPLADALILRGNTVLLKLVKGERGFVRKECVPDVIDRAVEDLLVLCVAELRWQEQPFICAVVNRSNLLQLSICHFDLLWLNLALFLLGCLIALLGLVRRDYGGIVPTFFFLFVVIKLKVTEHARLLGVDAVLLEGRKEVERVFQVVQFDAVIELLFAVESLGVQLHKVLLENLGDL